MGTTPLLLDCVFLLARSAWRTQGTLQRGEPELGQTLPGAPYGTAGTRGRKSLWQLRHPAMAWGWGGYGEKGSQNTPRALSLWVDSE